MLVDVEVLLGDDAVVREDGDDVELLVVVLLTRSRRRSRARGCNVGCG